MIELDGPIQTVGMDNFTEASYLHKHGATYYLSYSRNGSSCSQASAAP